MNDYGNRASTSEQYPFASRSEEQGQNALPFETDLYAVLNISRGSSPEEVRDSYRQFAVLLHPDKQKDEKRKNLASDRFQRIKEAFEVLSDPQRREVYDRFGEAGLDYSKQVGQKFKSSSEIIEDIERLARRNAAETSGFGHRSTVTLGLDARRLLRNSFIGKPSLSRSRGSVVTEYSIRNSLQAKYGHNGTVSMTARIGRAGAGSLIGTIRHQFPKLRIESDVGIVGRRFLNARAFYGLDQYSELAVTSSINSLQIFPPTFSISLTRILYPNIRGSLSYGSGWPFMGDPRAAAELGLWTPSSFTMSFGSDLWTCGAVLKPTEAELVGERHFHVSDATKISVGGSLGLPLGLALTAGATQDWADFFSGRTSFGFTIVWSIGAVILRVRFNRDGQAFVLPIILSDDRNSTSALLATMLPAGGVAIAELFMMRTARAKRRKAARDKYAARLDQRRTEALSEVDLMSESVIKRREAERSKNGLVILAAKYGPTTSPGEPPTLSSVASSERGSENDAPSSSGSVPSFWEAVRRAIHDRTSVREGSSIRSEIVDVTIQVQALVHSSQLRIPGGHSKVRRFIVSCCPPGCLSSRKWPLYLPPDSAYLPPAVCLVGENRPP